MTEIPDIKRNGYIFSDGIGKISSIIALAISNALGLHDIPSAFQVRLGGYKGVLAVDPSLKPDDIPIQFRPSQRKFDSKSQSSLDIIRCATYSPAFLNHQIITLLSSMHVKDSVFMDMQRDMQRSLNVILTSADVALDVIRPHAGENEAFGILTRMLQSGVNLKQEAFMRNLLQLY